MNPDGPLQNLAPGEQATATIAYSITDGADTVPSQVEVTIIASATKGREYDVTKAFVPPAPARALGRAEH